MPASPPASQAPAGPDLAGLAAGLGLDEAEVFANFGDPFWRLTCGGIYKIRSEDGEPIDFIPTPQQLVVLEEIYIHGSRTLVVPKARQVRMSTVIALIVLDTILFGSSVQCSLCDIDIPNADRKLDEKVFFAYERLPEALKGYWTTIKKSLSPGIFTIQHGDDATSKSTFYAGQKARGGTNQILWMSEWAELAAKHPAMSAEYLRGAWPAAAEGIRIIESTWYGGKSGDVWGIAKKGLDPHTGLPLARDKCTPRTPRVLFFPWYVIAARRLPCHEPSLIRPEVRAYFAKALEGTGDTLDDDQMYWYQEEALDIYHHEAQFIYPTNIHECWNANIEGSIWGAALGMAKAAGRVGEVAYRPDLEVDTFWDLGAPENSPCLYVQHDHEQRKFIDLDAEIEGGEVADRVRLLKEKGYRYGTHYLPHDAGQRQKNGKTYFSEFEAELKAQGVSGRVVQLKQTGNKWLGINHFTGLLKKSVWIDDKKCVFLLESIAAYRRKPDKTKENKFLDDVVDDWSCHCSDVCRYVSEAFMEGHLPHTSNGIMANLYFDPTRLQAAMASLPEHPPTLMALDRAGVTWQHVASRHDTGGWLRVWETPLQGPRYVVAVINGAVAVWRAAGWDRNASAERPARLVAACVDEAGINQDKLLSWASMASTYYGMVPVVADIVSIPGAVEKLREQGVGVAARQQSLAERRVGQATAIRKPGHEFGPEERQQAYAVLQELWRDGAVEMFCPSVLRQMGGIIATEQGGFEVLSGYAQHWLDVAALGVWTLGLAAPAMQAGRLAPEHTGGGYRGDREENSGLPFERQRRKLF